MLEDIIISPANLTYFLKSSSYYFLTLFLQQRKFNYSITVREKNQKFSKDEMFSTNNVNTTEILDFHREN